MNQTKQTSGTPATVKTGEIQGRGDTSLEPREKTMREKEAVTGRVTSGSSFSVLRSGEDQDVMRDTEKGESSLKTLTFNNGPTLTQRQQENENGPSMTLNQKPSKPMGLINPKMGNHKNDNLIVSADGPVNQPPPSKLQLLSSASKPNLNQKEERLKSEPININVLKPRDLGTSFGKESEANSDAMNGKSSNSVMEERDAIVVSSGPSLPML